MCLLASAAPARGFAVGEHAPNPGNVGRGIGGVRSGAGDGAPRGGIPRFSISPSESAFSLPRKISQAGRIGSAVAPEPVVDGARAREGARIRRYVVDIPLGLVRVSIAVSIAIVRAGVRVAGASLVIRVPGGSQGQRLEVDVVVVVGRFAVVDATGRSHRSRGFCTHFQRTERLARRVLRGYGRRRVRWARFRLRRFGAQGLAPRGKSESAKPGSRRRRRAADARASSSPFALGEVAHAFGDPRIRPASRKAARSEAGSVRRRTFVHRSKARVRRDATLSFPGNVQEPFACRHRPARRARSVDARQRPTERIYRRSRVQPSLETEVRGSAWAKWRPADSRFHTSVRGLSPNSRIDRGFGSCTRVQKRF